MSTQSKELDLPTPLGEDGEAHRNVPNPFFPDRCLAYKREFDVYKQAGIWPGFWELGDRIHESVISGEGDVWILKEGIREGNTSLGYYLARGREGARGVVYDSMIDRPKSACEAFTQIVNNSRFSLDSSPIESGEISAHRFKSEMNKLAEDGGFVLMIDRYDYLTEILSELDFELVTQTLSEIASAPAGMEGGKIGLLLNTSVRRKLKVDPILSRHFPEAKTHWVRLPSLTPEDIVKMGGLVPQVPIDESGFQQIYYLTGGHPALTHILLDNLVRSYNWYGGSNYANLSRAQRISAQEISKVGCATVTNVDGWTYFQAFWTGLTMKERAEILRIALRPPRLATEESKSHVINLKKLGRIGQTLRDDDKEFVARVEQNAARLHHLDFSDIEQNEKEILERLVLKGLVHREQEDGVYTFGPAILLWLALIRRAP